jgi:hypothetical protein
MQPIRALLARTLAAAVLLAAAPAAAVTLTRGPYLQMLTTRAVTVAWNTDAAAACSLAIRPLGGVTTVIAGGTGTACAIAVEGLARGAQYGYVPRAGSVALASESVFQADHPDLPYTFFVLGDFGCSCSTQRAVRDRMLGSAAPADFILSTGDQVYDSGALADQNPKLFDVYRDLLRAVPFYPTLGNHDWRTDSGGPWRAVWYTPANNPARTENYYSFDFGNAHVVVINSNESTSPGSAQHTFIDRDLAASRATWKLAAFHHTIYSSGSHGSSGIRANLVPLFDRHHVDVVFMGHDHDYERTMPLRDDRVVPAGQGTVYITTGGGGSSIRPVGSSSFTAYAESAFHFTRVRVDGTTLTTEMVRSDGAVRDTMTLVKGSAPPPTTTTTLPDPCGDGACDDGDPCTVDRCDPATGGCRRTPVANCCHTAAECDDGDACTDDSCVANQCRHDLVGAETPVTAIGRALDACGGQLPPGMARRLARAQTLIQQAERAQSPRRARRLLHATRPVLRGVTRSTARGVRRRRIDPACASALAAAVGGAPAGGQCQTTAVSPIADTYIEAGLEATWDHGASDHLDVDARPFGITYLKFDLRSFTAGIGRAVLELHPTNSSDDGGRVYRILDSSWQEGTGTGVDPSAAGGPALKWTDVDTNDDGTLDARDRSALVPDGRQVVGSLGLVIRGVRQRADVTPAFRDGPGIYTLAFMTGTSDGSTYCSREHPAVDRRPILRVTVGTPPAACGDGVLTTPEECDGSADARCPGRCRVDCTCAPAPPPGSLACLAGDGPLVVRSGDFTTQLRFGRELPDGARVDARGARFHSMATNRFPIRFDNRLGFLVPGTTGRGACIAGGVVVGEYPRTWTWADSKANRDAGIMFWNERFTVEGIRIDNVHDAIRPLDGNHWTVRGSWLSYVRDDCIENDHMRSGLVEDSLFDGCYVFQSTRPSATILGEGWDGTNEVVTVRDSLVYLQPMPGPDTGSLDPGTGSIFKWHSGTPSKSPKLSIHGTIFRLDQLAGPGAGGMGVPAGKLLDCSNNTVVWLGPGSYPASLPSCFTVTRSRAVWDNAVARWKQRHPEVGRP